MQQYKIDNFLKDTQQFQFLDPVIWFKNVMLHSDLFIYLHFYISSKDVVYWYILSPKFECGITVVIKVVKQHSGCNLMDKF